MISGRAELSLDNPGGTSVSLAYNESALIVLSGETRFFRGIEVEIVVPQDYLYYRGSLAAVFYAETEGVSGLGVADMNARQIYLEPIPNKIQSLYQIPLRAGHGLRNSPYTTVLSTVVPAASFPMVLRIMPVIKGISTEVEAMKFTLNVRPIMSDEGAVRIVPRYPENLPGRSFSVYIDDQLISPSEERFLKEGEHHLVVLSSEYRNESRVFIVERGKIQDIGINLQDPTPLIIFEAPGNTRIFFDNVLILPGQGPLPAEPGNHELRFQLNDYSIVRTMSIEKGKTYRVAMSIDV
ncbi:MAG: hypothetical protein LBT11_05370, partial [Treponema sp.]|nr:hypothetical protein [Treponema sp.]